MKMPNLEQAVTTDTILSWIEEQVREHRLVPPAHWMDASVKLVALLGGENDKLFLMEQKINQMIAEKMSEGKSAAAAKVMVGATDEYRMMQTQKARVKQVERFVSIVKVQARLRDSEMRL
jgi:hypothetical protein